jgi:hypothetical protein
VTERGRTLALMLLKLKRQGDTPWDIAEALGVLAAVGDQLEPWRAV